MGVDGNAGGTSGLSHTQDSAPATTARHDIGSTKEETRLRLVRRMPEHAAAAT